MGYEVGFMTRTTKFWRWFEWPFWLALFAAIGGLIYAYGFPRNVDDRVWLASLFAAMGVCTMYPGMIHTWLGFKNSDNPQNRTGDTKNEFWRAMLWTSVPWAAYGLSLEVTDWMMSFTRSLAFLFCLPIMFALHDDPSKKNECWNIILMSSAYILLVIVIFLFWENKPVLKEINFYLRFIAIAGALYAVTVGVGSQILENFRAFREGRDLKQVSTLNVVTMFLWVFSMAYFSYVNHQVYGWERSWVYAPISIMGLITSFFLLLSILAKPCTDWFKLRLQNPSN